MDWPVWIQEWASDTCSSLKALTGGALTLPCSTQSPICLRKALMKAVSSAKNERLNPSTDWYHVGSGQRTVHSEQYKRRIR